MIESSNTSQITSQLQTLEEGHTQAATLSQAQDNWRQLFQSRRKRSDAHLHPQSSSRPIHLTTENMHSNIAWGDILTSKAENITRIYALNVNGLTLDNRGGQFDSLCSLARETQTDIFCCQEHKIDTTNTRVCQCMLNPVLIQMHSCLLIVMPLNRSIQWGSVSVPLQQYNRIHYPYTIHRRASTVLVPPTGPTELR